VGTYKAERKGLSEAEIAKRQAIEMFPRFHPEHPTHRQARGAWFPSELPPNDPPAPLAIGDRVTHDKFGQGNITLIEDDGKLVIQFDSAGEKRIAGSSYVRRVAEVVRTLEAAK
jgi:hypothetical protein